MKFFTTALIATAATAVTLNDYQPEPVEHQHISHQKRTTFDVEERQHIHLKPKVSYKTETSVGYKTEFENHIKNLPTTEYDTEFSFHSQDLPRQINEFSYDTREQLLAGNPSVDMRLPMQEAAGDQ